MHRENIKVQAEQNPVSDDTENVDPIKHGSQIYAPAHIVTVD